MTPPALSPAFGGAVLTGGASRRMGRDKATAVAVGGEALASRTARILWAGGAAEVLAIGGPPESLAALGLDSRPDRHPGEGPLGGVLTALAESAHDLVVVLACDLPDLGPDVVGALAVAACGHDVAVAVTPRREPLVGAWWGSRCAAEIEAAFAAGERAVHRVLDRLDVAEVPVAADVVRNVNTPADLAR